MFKTIICNSVMAEDLGKVITKRGYKFSIGKAIYQGKDNDDLVELTTVTDLSNKEIVNTMKELRPYC